MPKFNNETIDAQVCTSTQVLGTFNMSEWKDFVLQHDVTVTTPVAATFVAAVTDICTAVAHGAATGLKVRLTTTTTLPAGLSLATDYFVIKLTVDTFKLASSLANALLGTAVDITDTGTGVHTMTPTSIAGGVIKVQESVDSQIWFDIASATDNITATGVDLIQTTTKCGTVRAHLTLTAGQISITLKTNTKD
jgi:hypothetical protein